MDPPVAQVFSLDSLFHVLDGTIPVITHDGDAGNYSVVRDVNRDVVNRVRESPEIQKFHQIAKDVDNWLEKKSIPQMEANIIRKDLAINIREYWKSNYSKWVGMRQLPSMTKGNLTLIYIPYNTNNPSATLACFITEKTLEQYPLKYKTFMIALLRRDAMGGWNYDGGYQDYCLYKNFISEWVTEAIAVIVTKQRELVNKSLTDHVVSAFVLDPGIGQRTLREKVSLLCTSQEKLKENIVNTGIESWDTYRNAVVERWQNMQEAWLWSFATNHHALEGDLVQSSLRGATESDVPLESARVAQSAQNQLTKKYSAFELLEGCSDKEQFVETLKSLTELVGSLSSAAEYKGMEDQLTARKYINRIIKVTEGNHWPSVKALLALRAPFEAKSVIRELNLLESEKVDDVDELMTTWKKLYEVNKPRMEAENQAQGGGRRLEIKGYIDELLNDTNKMLQNLKAMST